MGTELALCNAMASCWGMAGAVLYLPAAGILGLQWGHSTEPLLPWGQLPWLWAELLWLGDGSALGQPGLCPFLCCDGEQEPWGTGPQGRLAGPGCREEGAAPGRRCQAGSSRCWDFRGCQH